MERARETSSPYPEAVNRLMEEFASLPGIGRRSAERLAFFILKSDRASALRLARAVSDVKELVRHCGICSNFTDQPVCALCADGRRDHGTILVVEQPKDLISLEVTGMYRGGYHVLLGHLAPLDGVGPEALTVDGLLARVNDPARNAQGAAVREVIFGLSPNLEGDGTALYLTEQLKGKPITLSRLARGLPTGSSIEFANKAVLADAILGRQGVE